MLLICVFIGYHHYPRILLSKLEIYVIYILVNFFGVMGNLNLPRIES